jgi:DNA-directed RNA polymerase subunit RPC12/RpoP
VNDTTSYNFVDRRCGHPRCDEPGVYRMVGACYNCGAKPLLGLFTAGHEATGGECPACGCRRLHWDRLATPAKIPAGAA